MRAYDVNRAEVFVHFYELPPDGLWARLLCRHSSFTAKSLTRYCAGGNFPSGLQSVNCASVDY